MARGQGIRAKGEIHFAGAKGSELPPEQSVGLGQRVIGTDPTEAVEDHIGGSVHARARQCEDIGLGGMWVEGQTQDQEQGDASEQEV